ncbi:IclR family transcriptional regulator [Mycobacterium angelicum]|uniref:IclR family transcriptional regulator n=1 Tax=Mycobacterium angelicum TaxID=470074 RepID=A0A1W9ZWP9_MYCAN|nr:IclR family transcriptional regulator [Mycobacterium angelicum]MCV7199705.1 IclR family transcriptional regulator [Mycobacterium angelicum]ORA22229.1 IclR family transcriptional regulator [Mycobacterium angelicum]
MSEHEAAVPASATAKEHRTVSRVTTILERVAAGRNGVRLTELTAALDAPRSSVHDLVKGLVATGYLQEKGGTYWIGPAIGALLMTAPPSIDPVARPAMEALHRRFDETVMLASRVGDSVVYTDAVESTQSIRYSAPLHTRRPLYPTSAGSCFLAFGPEPEREAFLAERFDDVEQRTLVRTELEAVRADGVALNDGKTLPDVSGVGAPVLINGRVVGVLCVAGPTTRLGDLLPTIAAAVKAAAEEVSKRLTSHF